MNRDESITYAKQYLENILSFFGLNTDVAVSCDDDVIELSVPSTHLNGFLIGQRGDTLRSLQQLVSTTLKNRDAELTRVPSGNNRRASPPQARLGRGTAVRSTVVEGLATPPRNKAGSNSPPSALHRARC